MRKVVYAQLHVSDYPTSAFYFLSFHASIFFDAVVLFSDYLCTSCTYSLRSTNLMVNKESVQCGEQKAVCWKYYFVVMRVIQFIITLHSSYIIRYLLIAHNEL